MAKLEVCPICENVSCQPLGSCVGDTDFGPTVPPLFPEKVRGPLADTLDQVMAGLVIVPEDEAELRDEINGEIASMFVDSEPGWAAEKPAVFASGGVVVMTLTCPHCGNISESRDGRTYTCLVCGIEERR